MAKITPISQVMFDLTLPKEDESTPELEKVYWDTATPREGGLAVRTQDVMTLAITIATGIKMRGSGDARFGVAYDETEGVSPSVVALLQKQLLTLAKC